MNNQTKIIKNTLRVLPNQGSYSKNWSPRFAFQLTGPIPSGSVIIGEFYKPNETTKWIEITTNVNEINENEIIEVKANIHQEEKNIEQEGKFKFVIRLVSELEGVDQKLAEGIMEVVKKDNGSQPTYEPKLDWLTGLGKITLDVIGDEGAPRLLASLNLHETEYHQVEAYLFYKGKKIKSSENREDGVDVSSDSNVPYSNSYTDIIIEFASVLGYTNYTYDRTDIFDLSANPGEYEIKLAKEKKLAGSIKFTVNNEGHIEKTGDIEPHKYRGAWMYAPKDKIAKDAFYEMKAESALLDMEYYYKHRIIKEAEVEKDPNQEWIDSFIFKMNIILSRYDDKLEKAATSEDYNSQQGEADIFMMAHADQANKLLKEAEEKNIVTGEVEKICNDVKTLIKNVDIILARLKEDSDKRKEPYVKVLKNDKLNFFNTGYIYYTSKKKELTNPEEMKKAKVWYEQGWENTGKINEMWILRGYHFDDDHVLVDTIEETGLGGTIPTSFFK